MKEQPHFRFHPNAYDGDAAFKRSETVCDICDRPAVWLYIGEIYMEAEPPEVCARCIADGGLRRRLPPDSFTLQDVILDDADETFAEEILYATPGVASLNPFEWPVIEGKPLAFVGEGDAASLKGDAAASAAIKAAFEEIGEADGHPSHALVFKQIDGDTHIAVLDLD